MLEYHLDLQNDSYWHILTPDACARSFPFYVEECGFFSANDGYFTRRDHLDSYLLMVTVKGEGLINTFDQKTTLRTGDAILIDCNPYQEYRTKPEHTWMFYFVHFRSGSMDGFRNSLISELTSVHLQSPESIVRQIEGIAKRRYEKGPAVYANQSLAISSILTEMLNKKNCDHLVSYQSDRCDIENLATFIREHASEDLHIDDFCQYIRLSQHYLIRIFKRQYGLTPYQYLHKCRIDHSLELLQTTAMPVKDIAKAVGYTDPVVFIRHFQAFCETSPGMYRKQWMQNNITL